MAKEDPPPESTVRYRGMRPLGETLGRVVKPLVKDRPLAETQLILEWPQVVGDELAAMARPLKVRFDRPAERLAGVLELACDGGAALELQHRAPQIIERVNAWLGYQAIARLRLRQVERKATTVVPPPPKRAVKVEAPALPPTGDAGLDEALSRLQLALLQKRNRKT